MSATEFVAAAAPHLPSLVMPGDRVYKDDCMYLYDTAENNPNGLDVCMTCFQAFSRSEHRNYTAEHYRERRHALFLNIVKTLKPPAPEETPKKPKLEIKEQKEDDIYNTTTSVYVAALDAYVGVEQLPAPAQNLAAALIAADSASTVDDVKAWELEVYPCSHSENIATEPRTVDLHKCTQCDLQENLWMCLTCGSVACGREQFGSALRGNSHALAHHDASGHAVAVKLGSLSPDEDACDCYCYACNDEVKVPGLGATLRGFGVDLGAAVKTEKTLVELNLATNQNWQFNLEGADGDMLMPVFGPGLTGIQNLGNSCYLNSVVQALFSFDAYRGFFENAQFDKKVPDPAHDLPCQMLKLYDGLLSGRYSRPSALKGDAYQAGIRPASFKALIGKDHAEFRTTRQQDAFEFLLWLMDRLDKTYGVALNRSFKFVVGTRVVCGRCGAATASHDLVDNVSVPLADAANTETETTLAECFEQFHATETIDHFQCSTCGDGATALKTAGFQTYPENLIVNVQRIKLDNWVPVKVDAPVAVPEQVDLSEYAAPEYADAEVRPDAGAESGSGGATAKFEPNSDALAMLLNMGFSEPRSLRALYHTGNSDADAAMTWVFAHMDDADIDSPFDPEAESAGAGSTASAAAPSQDAVDSLVAMGFSAKLATKALVVAGDANAAVEWLFAHPDDDGEMENTKPAVDLQQQCRDLKRELLLAPLGGASYELKAVVCHKGTSPHTGHYVAFVKHEGKWVLFNDEKVVECGTNLADVRNNAYIYFFGRV